MGFSNKESKVSMAVNRSEDVRDKSQRTGKSYLEQKCKYKYLRVWMTRVIVRKLKMKR